MKRNGKRGDGCPKSHDASPSGSLAFGLTPGVRWFLCPVWGEERGEEGKGEERRMEGRGEGRGGDEGGE